MTHNQILYVYCSKEDGITILRETKQSLQGVHLDITIIKTKLSFKKICTDQRKRYPLQKGDYIIAIDCPITCLFKRDYSIENLLHFESLYHFLKWLGENFG